MTLLTCTQSFAFHPKQGYQIQILNKIIASQWEWEAFVAQGASHPCSHLHLLPGQVQTNSEEKASEKILANKNPKLLTDCLRDPSFSLQELIYFIATMPTQGVKIQLKTSGNCFGVWLHRQGWRKVIFTTTEEQERLVLLSFHMCQCRQMKTSTC